MLKQFPCTILSQNTRLGAIKGQGKRMAQKVKAVPSDWAFQGIQRSKNEGKEEDLGGSYYTWLE